jgi:probable F420-dependent oxidoreductase
VHYGLTLLPTEYSISPADLAEAAEARGFESLWFPDHSHIPVARRSPWPGGGEMPKMYSEALEPFLALAAAATATRRLALGTGVCLVVQRDPIHTAKAVATLDRISNGRVLFGIGAGWNAEEMANHGTTDFRGRFRLMRERVEAMREIWTKDCAEYHGECVDFDPVHAWPKPARQPHPPVHVGGAFPGAARRAVRYGQGWMPPVWLEPVAQHIPAFRELARQAGRDPDTLEVTAFGQGPEQDAVMRLRDAGVARVIFGLPPQDRDALLPLIDHYAALARAVG